MPALTSILVSIGLEILGGLIFGVGGIIGLLAISLKAAKDHFGTADFEKTLRKWLEKIKPVITKKEFITELCEKASEAFIKKWAEDSLPQFESLYEQSRVKDMKIIKQFLQLHDDINLTELEEINVMLTSLMMIN